MQYTCNVTCKWYYYNWKEEEEKSNDENVEKE